jgi:hypothetical protein
MEQLINIVNKYPWTSFWTFLMIYILLSMIVRICETIFLTKKNK